MPRPSPGFATGFRCLALSGSDGFSLLHSLLIRRENILLKDVGGARKRQRMLPQRYFEEMSFMLRIH